MNESKNSEGWGILQAAAEADLHGEGNPFLRIERPPAFALQVHEGDRFSLTCSAAGRPPPMIEWRWNGHPISEEESDTNLTTISDDNVENLNNIQLTTIETGVTKSRLTIDCADRSMGGIYSCVALSYANDGTLKTMANTTVGVLSEEDAGK